MTRIQEDRHPGEPWLLWKIGNLTAIDQDRVRTVAAAWGFQESERWCFRPRRCENRSLFYNALVFVRFNWPFGLFWGIRWAASGARAFWQAGFGWKLNGRLAVLFRVSGDASAAKGVTGPNYGQAQGFEFGPH